MTMPANDARMMHDDLTNSEVSIEELEAVAGGDPSFWVLLSNLFGSHNSGTAGTARPGSRGPTYML